MPSRTPRIFHQQNILPMWCVLASSGIISSEFLCCTKGCGAATLESDLIPPIFLNFLYRRSRRRYWFIVELQFSRAHMATVASQEKKFQKGRVASSGTLPKGVLGFICPLGRRDAFRWAKKENCKSTCKNVLNAEENPQKLQSENRVTVWCVSSCKVFKCKACYN